MSERGTRLDKSYRCLECGGPMHVTDSRAAAGGTHRRRRACGLCGHRATTYEVECARGTAVALIPMPAPGASTPRMVPHDLAPTPAGTWLAHERRPAQACGYCFGYGAGACPVCG